MELDKGLYFCSLTCMILCGYMSARTDQPRKDISELKDKKVRDKLLSEGPFRERPTKKDYL